MGAAVAGAVAIHGQDIADFPIDTGFQELKRVVIENTGNQDKTIPVKTASGTLGFMRLAGIKAANPVVGEEVLALLFIVGMVTAHPAEIVGGLGMDIRIRNQRRLRHGVSLVVTQTLTRSAPRVSRPWGNIDAMEAVTAAELEQCFDGSDEEVWLPDWLDELGDDDWQHRDYLGWVHPSGHLGYLALVSPNSGRLCGVVLKRQRRGSGGFRLDMCSWCHHVHRMGGTAMFTVSVRGTGGRHRIGRVVCKDLDCSLRIRNLVEPDSLIRESLYKEARIWRMQNELYRWLNRAKRI